MINTPTTDTPQSAQKNTPGATPESVERLIQGRYMNATEFADHEKLLDGLVELENATWPEGTRAAREAFASRIAIFPEGVYFHEEGGHFGGLTTSVITQVDDPNNIKSWEEITDCGYIKNHTPSGNALYVVSVGVGPNFQGKGIGQELVRYQIELAKKLGMQYLFLGSRVPDYHKHNQMPIEEYLRAKNEKGQTLDSLVRFYERCGLKVGKIKQNYMEDDKESLNYGVIMTTEF